MEFELIPMTDEPQRSTPLRAANTSHYGRAGKARHNDQALIAGYEAGMRDPGAWHHIGQHMHADAAPVSKRPRWLGRSIPRRDNSDRLITIRLVIAVAFVAAAVIVINTFPAGHP